MLASPRLLVLYGTTDGHTRSVATAIGDALHLEGAEVDVIDAKYASPALDLSPYAAVIIAASVRAGHYQRSVARWISEHAAALSAKPTAFVSVCLAVLNPDPAAKRAAAAVYEKFFAATGWRPRRVKVVAGALLYTRYGWLRRWIMRRISAKAHGDTDTSRDYVYTDWHDVRAFAHEFFKAAVPQLDQVAV